MIKQQSEFKANTNASRQNKKKNPWVLTELLENIEQGDINKAVILMTWIWALCLKKGYYLLMMMDGFHSVSWYI